MAARAGANAELWEKIVRKLRTNAMPPAGLPRPDQAAVDSVSSYLEAELDRAAAEKPNASAITRSKWIRIASPPHR